MMIDPFSDLTDRPVRGVLHLLQEGIQTLFHLLLFSLLLLGFGGLIYKALRSGGWIQSILESFFWAQHPATAIVALLAAVAVAAGAKRYFDNVSMTGKRGDVLVYGCLALGLFFAFKLIVTGTL